MFRNGKFRELKGVQFDRDMKLRFVDYFTRSKYFEIYYIRVTNHELKSHLFENSARIFNYSVRLALEHFIRTGLLPDEDCHLQLDERNEKKRSKTFPGELSEYGAGRGRHRPRTFQRDLL